MFQVHGYDGWYVEFEFHLLNSIQKFNSIPFIELTEFSKGILFLKSFLKIIS